MSVHCLPAFEDNYIWLVGAPGKNAVVAVDPGDEDPVIEWLVQTGCKLEAILITHHHGDHTGGVQELATRYRVPVFGPAREAITGVTHPLREGEQLEFPASGVRLRVLDTPGHTRGHICYVGDGLLFCGDTLFTGGCGRLFEGTAEQMFTSLEKLRALPDDTAVYCAHEYTLANLQFAQVVEPHGEALRRRAAEDGRRRRHGEPTVPAPLGLEKQTNPFLRWDVREVVKAAEGFAGRPLDMPAAVFGTLRHWKDTLD